MKRLITLCLALMILVTVPVGAADLQGDAKSVILMEATTGKVLYEFNADEALPPASVTKIMTVLLVVEAVDRGQIALTDPVAASANAASMGGSQIYLKEGEVMCVDDLLKSVVVASANDAAVALAEYVAGSESAFVDMMNARAAELGMVNTHFENTNGLDDTTTGHLTSARDIAIMSAQLLTHPVIFNYTTIWMDTVRDGQFGLTNTNRLIKFYNGANGLKTGSTSRAGFCISATAKRDGMQLIAVIMGASTRDARNAVAQSLLDYGFSGYSFQSLAGEQIPDIAIRGGEIEQFEASYPGYQSVTEKNAGSLTREVTLNEDIIAPVHIGDEVGKVTYRMGDQVVFEAPVCSDQDVERLGYMDALKMLVKKWFIL